LSAAETSQSGWISGRSAAARSLNDDRGAVSDDLSHALLLADIT
jgi:hypothetical protein